MKQEYTKFFAGKKIIVYGGTGSWGQELVKQLVRDCAPSEVRIFSRGEHKQVEMRRKYRRFPFMKYIVGDVRDADAVAAAMKGVDIVFNLAALKHVPVCEENVWEAIQTNIHGAHNIVDAAQFHGVKVAVQVSTDKAVDPINLYGFTKGCAEKLFTSAQTSFRNESNTKFVCVRGGNVLNTNGSVVPLFRHLLREHNAISITDENMSRYLMRVEEAIHLVLKATVESHGGEVFVMKMPGAKIINLAKTMIKRLGNKETKTTIIGIRPGEKMYEVLVSSNESPRTVEDGEYYVILPDQLQTEYRKGPYKKHSFVPFAEYNSENAEQLSNKQIEALLDTDHLLDQNRQDDFDDVFSPFTEKEDQ